MSKDKTKPRLKVPKSVTAGEAFTVNTLINHKMESGRRKWQSIGRIPEFSRGCHAGSAVLA